MKNLRQIIRENLELLFEEDKPSPQIKKGDEKYPNLVTAKEIFWALDDKYGFPGTDVNKLLSAIQKINSSKDFNEVNSFYTMLGQYEDLADALNQELEISGTGGLADNLPDFKQIKDHLQSKGVTVSGGWDGKQKKPIVITVPAQQPAPQPDPKTDDKKQPQKKGGTKTDGPKLQVTPLDTTTRDLQTLISKTPHATEIITSKSTTGIDGRWGKKTSTALLKILNDYQSIGKVDQYGDLGIGSKEEGLDD